MGPVAGYAFRLKTLFGGLHAVATYDLAALAYTNSSSQGRHRRPYLHSLVGKGGWSIALLLTGDY